MTPHDCIDAADPPVRTIADLEREQAERIAALREGELGADNHVSPHQLIISTCAQSTSPTTPNFTLTTFRTVRKRSDKHDGRETPQQQPFVSFDSCEPSSRVAGRVRCGAVLRMPGVVTTYGPATQPQRGARLKPCPTATQLNQGKAVADGSRLRQSHRPRAGVGARSGLRPGMFGGAA